MKDRASIDIETVLGGLLSAGVLASAGLLAASLFWRWIATGRAELDYQIAGLNLFEFIREDVRQFASGRFRPRLLANTGITLLLLTPYFRVAASLVYFAAVRRNAKYAVFTGFVFLVLTCTLFLR